MIAVVLPAAIAAFTSGQVRSSMYTDCAPPECSVAAGGAANAATLRKRAIAVNSKTHLISGNPLLYLGRLGYGHATAPVEIERQPQQHESSPEKRRLWCGDEGVDDDAGDDHQENRWEHGVAQAAIGTWRLRRCAAEDEHC